MKAIAYCRVSSVEQVEGTSLAAQEEQIRAYAKLKGIRLERVFSDMGVSGGKPISERPEGKKLVETIESGGVSTVIILKLDRAFRNVVDCLQSVDAWEEKRIALHIVDLGGNSIDTTSPAGRFMLTVLSAAAEMERGLINDRCNNGRAARKAEGKRIGEIPFGYALAPDGKTLVESGEEQRAIRLARKLKRQGHSANGIAQELNRRGIPTKKGRAWTHVQVTRLLKRAA